MNIYYICKKFKKIPEILVKNKFPYSLEKLEKKVVLILSKNFPKKRLNLLKKIFKENIYKIIIKPHGEPSTDIINKFRTDFPKNINFLVIGGGSTIDFAKALSIVDKKNKIEQYEFDKKVIKTFPLYCIPTTCGSGSDVSPYSVIINSKTKRKFTINSEKLVPKKTFIYPELLKDLKKKYIFSSLYDAFSHCLEVYFNKSQEKKIKDLALFGMQKGISLLNKKISHKHYYDYMMLSLVGGICISYSRTSIIHTLSVATNKYIPLPHGLLNLYLTNLGLDFNKIYSLKKAKIIKENFDLYSWVNNLEIKYKKFLKVKVKKIKSKSIVNRILQDKTLDQICYSDVNEYNLNKLVLNLNEKNKKILS